MKKIGNITKRSENYSRWYLDVIANADLAEHAPVKGCMIIKPYGYAIWEKMVGILDNMIKGKGLTKVKKCHKVEMIIDL